MRKRPLTINNAMVKTILVLCVTKLVGSYSNPCGLLPPQDATTLRKVVMGVAVEATAPLGDPKVFGR